MALYHNDIIISESSGFIYHNDVEKDGIDYIAEAQNIIIWRKQREIDILNPSTGGLHPDYGSFSGEFSFSNGKYSIGAWATINSSLGGANPAEANGTLHLFNSEKSKYTKAEITYTLKPNNEADSRSFNCWINGHQVYGHGSITVDVDSITTFRVIAEIEGDNNGWYTWVNGDIFIDRIVLTSSN